MQQRYMAIVLLTTSDCPSVYGWNVVLILNWLPANLNRTCRMRNGSRSLTMDLGMPLSLTMSWKNAMVIVAAEYGWPSGMKWVYFENRSTTVRITLLPWTRGRASMKSIEMTAQIFDEKQQLDVEVPFCPSGRLGRLAHIPWLDGDHV